MSEITHKVKDSLFSYLADCRMELGDRGNEGRQVEIIDSYIQLILSIPELAIVDREAELPQLYGGSEAMQTGYKQAQQDMLKAGWLKEVTDG